MGVHEELKCEREVGNRSDTFVVTMKKGVVTVIQWATSREVRISSICLIFIQRGGTWLNHCGYLPCTLILKILQDKHRRIIIPCTC